MHKDVKKAIAEAKAAGFDEKPLSGHTFSHIACACGEHIKVFSTGKNPTFGAKLIRKFVAKHRAHVKGGQ